MTHLRKAVPAALVLAASCAAEPPEQPPSSSRASSSARAARSAAPLSSSAASPTAGSGDGCSGRNLHDCARTKGCILDQPTYRKPQCRPADNACEAAVRHADLIGEDADPAVTADTVKAAQGACAATSGCVATAGHCSCPCALLGSCRCECGGHYLPRCTTKATAPVYDGLPPAEGHPGPLGELGNGLVAMARAPSGKRFVVNAAPPLAAIVGLQRHAIAAVLGTPTPCTEPFPAPCRSASQAFYSLYKLDKGARGGGPELLLTFDDKQKCTDAGVVHTR